MKKLILLIVITTSLFAQMPSTEYLYLDIYSDLTANLPNRNPAYLSTDNIPYSYAFKYNFLNHSGEYKLPFDPTAKFYHNVEVSAYEEMENGILFAGRFAYRNELRKDKLWLHHAETNIDIPFYFADSTGGDFNLKGIDWNVIFSYPLMKNMRFAMDVFYNVDEQFKSVFPKPSSKRNDLHIRPSMSFQNENIKLGVTSSIFNFKEEIETKKYSLEQNRTPIFMRIRGLDRALLSYAETTEERLQNINGYGTSVDITLADLFSVQAAFEKSNAEITDGGSDPVDQGSWTNTRMNYRADLIFTFSDILSSDLFFTQYWLSAKGYHPTLHSQIYALGQRHFEGGLGLTYNSSALETWEGIVSYAFDDLLREDTFLGLSHYIPADILHLGMDYSLQKSNIALSFNLAYELKDAGDVTEYNDLGAWYYQMITKKEIAYYAMDTESIIAGLAISFPYQNMKIAISGNYEDVKAMNSDETYHAANIKIELIY